MFENRGKLMKGNSGKQPGGPSSIKGSAILEPLGNHRSRQCRGSVLDLIAIFAAQ